MISILFSPSRESKQKDKALSPFRKVCFCSTIHRTVFTGIIAVVPYEKIWGTKTHMYHQSEDAYTHLLPLDSDVNCMAAKGFQCYNHTILLF